MADDKPTHTPARFISVALAIAATAVSLLPIQAPRSQYGPEAQQGPAYLSTLASPSNPIALAGKGLLSGPSVAEAAPPGTNSSNSVYYRQTAHYIKDAFLNYWLMNGSLKLYGYPITEEFVNNGVPTQYFERARFEYYPESRRAWKVELSTIGSALTQGRAFPPVEPTPDRTYFEQTHHSLGGAFLRFWTDNGGLDIFGYPLSEEIVENGQTVQYFERSRFELTRQGRVQLGHLGREMLQADMEAGLDPAVTEPRSRPGSEMAFSGNATWFRANWERVISLNKSWGNLPPDYVGRGLYAAAPADLGLYGRWARVTRGNRSIFVQFIDVINWPDIPYVRSRGIVIDLGEESYRTLGTTNGSRYDVRFEVLWPGDEP